VYSDFNYLWLFFGEPNYNVYLGHIFIIKLQCSGKHTLQEILTNIKISITYKQDMHLELWEIAYFVVGIMLERVKLN